MSFRRLKFRGDDTDRLEYFVQPFVGKNSKIQLMEDIASDTPVYRKSMIDEINAGIADDSQSMDVITRRTRTIMEPVTDDIDDIEIANFMDKFADDLDHSTGERPDGRIDDVDGYYILIPALPGMAVATR